MTDRDHVDGSGAPDIGYAFRCEIERRADEVRVTPVGELDIATCPELDAHLDRLSDPAITRLILDLTLTTFIDTTAVRLILSRHLRSQSAGRSFTVVAAPGQARRVLAVAGMDGLLDLREPS